MLSADAQEAFQKVEEWMARSQAYEKGADGKGNKPKPPHSLRRSMSAIKASELTSCRSVEALAGRRRMIGSVQGFGSGGRAYALKRSSSTDCVRVERDERSRPKADAGSPGAGSLSVVTARSPERQEASPLHIITGGLISPGWDWGNSSSPKIKLPSRSESQDMRASSSSSSISIHEGLSGLWSLFTSPSEGVEE
eukprot:241806-Hanusia_phi.AAC.1